MALSQAYHQIRRTVPVLVAHIRQLNHVMSGEEALGLIYQSAASDWLTQWWDAKCRWSWDFIDRINSLDHEVDLVEMLSISLKRARTSLRCLLDFGQIYGYKKKVELADLKSLLVEYLIQDFMGVMIKNFKYHLLFLANKARSAEAPPRDESIRNLDGWLLNWNFRTWCMRRLRRDETFGETLLLGIKRGLPSMDDRNVAKEVEDLLKDLSTPNDPTPQFLLAEVKRTAREIFGEQEPRPRKGMEFSARAGFEEQSGCRCGGIRSVVWRWATSVGYVAPEESLLFMKWGPHRGLAVEYGFPMLDDYPRLWERLVSLWIAVRQIKPRPTRCRVAVIFEPLKVRPITAGESFTYALGKAFQKPLWDSLQKFPQFSFTACPAGPAVVGELMSKRLWHENEVAVQRWVSDGQAGYDPRMTLFESADFRGATNYLHSDCTTAVLDEIYHDPLWRKIAGHLVEGHQIYHFERGQRGEDRHLNKVVFQASGQLMGSMISFPILCCINVAVLRAAYEKVLGYECRIEDLPCLINGDDLAARLSPEISDLWASWIPYVGFHKSPGKSYVSRDWVQINSRTFPIEYDRKLDMFLAVRQVGFVNFGVIEGFKKGIDPQHEPNLDLVAVRLGTIRKEFDHLRGKVRERAERCFIERYSFRCKQAYRLGKIPFIPSFVNPPEFGGLGIESGPFDPRAAHEARCWQYCPPTVREFLSGELIPEEQRWDRKEKRFLPDLDAWKAYKEQERLKQYLD